MRHCILTSSPTGPLDNSYTVNGLDHKNGFYELMKSLLKNGDRGLIIAAYPDRYAGNDEMCDYFRHAFETVGISFSTFDLMDDRYIFSKEDVNSYDFIVLAGGHTPKENDYFQRIDLKDKLKDFEGTVLGISAGSMNMADRVYFQPEEPGESGEWFNREGRGLALADVSIVPHLQMIRNVFVDGRSLVYDLIVKDSWGRNLLCMDDGTYIYKNETGTWLCGSSWWLHDGEFYRACEDNECVRIGG